MIFDGLAGIAERAMPELIPMLKAAHLFDFPKDPADALPKSYDKEVVELLRETFFLPFSVVAVEDPISCVLLFDSEEEQRGLGTLRYFVDCAPIRADNPQLCLPERQQRDIERILGRDAYFITCGQVDAIEIHHGEEKPMWIKGCVDRTVIASNRKMIVDTHGPGSDEVAEQLTSAALHSAKTAVEELFYFNTPNRFVVEKTPVQVCKPNPNVIVRRSDARSRYILLTPEEIRSKIGTARVDEADRKSPVPHHRRRHFRRLSSERYTSSRGKVIAIPASWIGPNEGSDGRNFYKIRLDL